VSACGRIGVSALKILAKLRELESQNLKGRKIFRSSYDDLRNPGLKWIALRKVSYSPDVLAEPLAALGRCEQRPSIPNNGCSQAKYEG